MNIFPLKLKLFCLLTGSFLLPSPNWYTSLSDARIAAQAEHKYVLLNFSGSDWCGPCIRMKKEFFESPAFKTLADSELILVNADFPRNKKNQPGLEQQKINDQTADKYNPLGKFPLTLLLSNQGTVLGSWEGLPNETPEQFIDEIHTDISIVRK